MRSAEEYHIDAGMQLSSLACAYARARRARRMSSFGDWIALSDVCDVPTAKIIKSELRSASRPGYEPDARSLKSPRKTELQCGCHRSRVRACLSEHTEVYGITFEQGRNSAED